MPDPAATRRRFPALSEESEQEALAAIAAADEFGRRYRILPNGRIVRRDPPEDSQPRPSTELAARSAR